MITPKIEYLHPDAVTVIRYVQQNIVRNLRLSKEGSVSLPNLVERAYLLVNETNMLAVQTYNADDLDLE